MSQRHTPVKKRMEHPRFKGIRTHITTHLIDNPPPPPFPTLFSQKKKSARVFKVQPNINKKTNIVCHISSIVSGKLDYSFDRRERKAKAQRPYKDYAQLHA